MKKIIAVGVVLVLVILVIAGIITNYADTANVTTGHEPEYCIKLVSQDGSKVTYWGLGYKVIRYVDVSPDEPYKNNIGVKMGSWFMKYELPIDSERNNNTDTDIKDLDDFYNTELTKNNDIRGLSKQYSSFDAQKDNCFVTGADVYNENLYPEFMEKYKNKETAYIRVAKNTVEGDLVLYDILYYKNTSKLYLVTDDTRDQFSSKEDRNIELTEFEKTSEYNYQNHLYWILCNGEVNDDNFNTENVFIVTAVN